MLVTDVRPACDDPGRLLGVVPRGRETLAEYLAGGGYRTLPDAEAILDLAAAAGLDGRGGAGFPLARKLRAVAEGEGPRVVVANGEEGEPASVKDRWVMRHRPHLVLDGLRIAAHAVDADTLILYVSDELSATSLQDALDELGGVAGWERSLPRLVRVDAAYVAGEETSVVRAIDGGEPKPTLKPPRPFEKGVAGRPTAVSNVESLARLALALDPDVGSQAARSLLTTVIDGAGASLLEVPVTATVGDLLAARRPAGAPAPIAVVMGGFAGGIWPPSILGATLERAQLRELGAGLGCGSIIAVEPGDCVVAVVTDIASYLAGQSSGQCGICVVGTGVVAEQLTAIAHGTADDELLSKLTRRVSMMRGRGNCALPDAVSDLVRTLFENFPEQVTAHLEGRCAVCASRVPEQPAKRTRFQVAPDPGSST